MSKFRLLPIILVLLIAGCAESPKTEALFCPEEQCESRTIAAIKNAETSIEVAIYSFTSKNIEAALIEAKERGVRCRLVLDFLQSKSRYSRTKSLGENGFEIRIAKSGKTMHNKFAIIDHSIVLTGSYNWTKNADTKNDENLVFIFDKKIANEYSTEFFELWVEAG